MDNQSTIPLSPQSAALFSLFTTLYDDESIYAPEVEQDHLDHEKPHPTQHNQVAAPPVQSAPRRHSKSFSGQASLETKYRVPKHTPGHSGLPGFICFSASTGEPAKIRKRSAFSQGRREEVKNVRLRGACLRCKLRKIPCSGDDPCKSCLLLADAKTGTRALMWMECVRPSLEALTIFEQVDLNRERIMLDEVMRDIVGQNDLPVIRAPFQIDLESTSMHLVQWLVDGTNHSDFSIAGLLRSGEFSQMLDRPLGRQTNNIFRLMVYLTNDALTRGFASTYRGHTADTLHAVGHYAGNIVLKAVEDRLRPARLEASRTKLDDLRALLLVTFGLSVTARYMYLLYVLKGQDVTPEFKSKAEAFIRLLNHYLIYIAGVLQLVDSSTQKQLAVKCDFQWDAPGSSVQDAKNYQALNLTWNDICGSTNFTGVESLQALKSNAPVEETSRMQLMEGCRFQGRGPSPPAQEFIQDDEYNKLLQTLPYDMPQEQLQIGSQDYSSKAWDDTGLFNDCETSLDFVHSDSFWNRASADNTSTWAQSHPDSNSGLVLRQDEQYCYSWDQGPGRFSAISHSYQAPSLHAGPRNGFVYTNGCRSRSRHAIARWMDHKEVQVKLPRAYWTFFSQTVPFKIHSANYQSTLIHDPTHATEHEANESRRARRLEGYSLEEPRYPPRKGTRNLWTDT